MRTYIFEHKIVLISLYAQVSPTVIQDMFWVLNASDIASAWHVGISRPHVNWCYFVCCFGRIDKIFRIDTLYGYLTASVPVKLEHHIYVRRCRLSIKQTRKNVRRLAGSPTFSDFQSTCIPWIYTGDIPDYVFLSTGDAFCFCA